MVDKRRGYFMTVNVNLVKKGKCMISQNFFNFECCYFVINSNGRLCVCNISVPIVRYYMSDIRILLYLSESSYIRLYNYCEKVGILC